MRVALPWVRGTETVRCVPVRRDRCLPHGVARAAGGTGSRWQDWARDAFQVYGGAYHDGDDVDACGGGSGSVEEDLDQMQRSRGCILVT